MYQAQCKLYCSIKCIVYKIHCKCTPHTAHCTANSIRCVIYRCTMYIYTVQNAIYSVQYSRVYIQYGTVSCTTLCPGSLPPPRRRGRTPRSPPRYRTRSPPWYGTCTYATHSVSISLVYTARSSRFTCIQVCEHWPLKQTTIQHWRPIHVQDLAKILSIAALVLWKVQFGVIMNKG